MRLQTGRQPLATAAGRLLSGELRLPGAGKPQGSYRDPTGILQGTYRDPAGIPGLPQGSYRAPAGLPQGSHRDHTGILQGSQGETLAAGVL